MSDYEKSSRKSYSNAEGSAYALGQMQTDAMRQPGLLASGLAKSNAAPMPTPQQPTVSGVVGRMASSVQHAHGILDDLSELVARVTGQPGRRTGQPSAKQADVKLSLIDELHGGADFISYALSDIEHMVATLKAAHG